MRASSHQALNEGWASRDAVTKMNAPRRRALISADTYRKSTYHILMVPYRSPFGKPMQK